jgi:hypothetical protein
MDVGMVELVMYTCTNLTALQEQNLSGCMIVLPKHFWAYWHTYRDT